MVAITDSDFVTLGIGLTLFLFFVGLGYSREEAFLVVVGGAVGLMFGLYLVVFLGVALWWLGIVLIIVGFMFTVVGALEVIEW